MKTAILAVTIAALVLTGCATTASQPYAPIVDTKGVDLNRYQADLDECRALGAQANPVQKAGEGAVAGAIIGGLLGAAIGGRGMAGFGAKIGAGEGLIGGAANGIAMQHVAIKVCLIGRSYRVLA